MTATSVVDQVDLGDHVCWIHDDDSDALDAVGRFAAAGLRRGHKVVCFTETSTPQAVRARVDAVGVPTEAAVAAGQLRILPAVDAFLADGRPTPATLADAVRHEVDQARREGYPGVRLSGDMAWVLGTGVTLDELRRYELALNPLFPDGRVAGLCLYDRRRYPADRLRLLGAAHPGTAAPSTPRTWSPLLRAYRIGDPAGLRLVGQVDRSNRDALVALLGGLTAGRTAGVPPVLDLTDLSFADAGAVTELARAVRAGGPGVRLVGCRPALRRLLHVLGGVTAGGSA
ncbi:MEDS domain-containing protein [Micromonospora sp. WMMC241]|uniref:MEDS domain-containing protein n=1 Tax=Micromonospora sp. WMMC241 TaxID=3015159 RepID=UPI0022B62371|nr:MEDS domain-containing protein [Micromonospora sp. WMMC241]MCZ7437441.1 MEDS domain-containing protein [Micromonospora sp. WMMC241]